MPKAGELDWSVLYKTGKNLKPEDPLSRPLEKSSGKESIENGFNQLVKDLVDGFKVPGVRQPTDKEMFGHLVKTQKDVDALKKDWDEKLHAHIDWKHAKVVKNHSDEIGKWSGRKSYNEIFKSEGMTEEELKKRNMTVSE